MIKNGTVTAVNTTNRTCRVAYDDIGIMTGFISIPKNIDISLILIGSIVIIGTTDSISDGYVLGVI